MPISRHFRFWSQVFCIITVATSYIGLHLYLFSLWMCDDETVSWVKSLCGLGTCGSVRGWNVALTWCQLIWWMYAYTQKLTRSLIMMPARERCRATAINSMRGHGASACASPVYRRHDIDELKVDRNYVCWRLMSLADQYCAGVTRSVCS